MVVGNKQDLYRPEDKVRLFDYVSSVSSPPPEILFTELGQLDKSLLQGETKTIVNSHSYTNRNQHLTGSPVDQIIPPEGFLRAFNQGEGFQSIGWRFSPEKMFDRDKLFVFLTGLKVARMKAVFITEEGVFSYNLTTDALTEHVLDDCLESCIEIITDNLNDNWESELLACLK